MRLLGTLRHVTLLHIHQPWASPAELERFSWYAAGAGGNVDPSLKQWGDQPGNFALMVKQVGGGRRLIYRTHAGTVLPHR